MRGWVYFDLTITTLKRGVNETGLLFLIDTELFQEYKSSTTNKCTGRNTAAE